MGPVEDRERPDRASSCARAGPGIGSQAAARRCRICSWTPRCPRAERDDWPIVATEDGAVVAVPGIAEAPGWEGAVRRDPEETDDRRPTQTSARS